MLSLSTQKKEVTLNKVLKKFNGLYIEKVHSFQYLLKETSTYRHLNITRFKCYLHVGFESSGF